MKSRIGIFFAAIAFCGAALGVSARVATAQPVEINLGRGAATEETVWLLATRPDLAPNYGKVYTLNVMFSSNTDKRYQALQADALDISTSNAHSALYAAAAGLPIKIIASVSKESSRAAHTRFIVKDDSGLKTVADLKGHSIGVVGLRSATHFWAAAALKKAGLDPDKDVTFIPLAFPLQGEGLRSGTVDVATVVEPFASLEFGKGGVHQIFSSKDGVPYDEELVLLVAREAFLKEKPDVARAFLSDLKAVTDYYLKHLKESRQALLDAQIVRAPAEIYLNMEDWYRTPDLKVDIELLKKMQELHLSLGMSDKAADIDSVVDLSYLPK